MACALLTAVGLAAGTASARTSQDTGTRAAADHDSRAAHPTLVQQALRAAAAQQPALAGATAQAAPGTQKPSPDKPGPGEQGTVPPVNFDVVVAAPRIDIPLKQSPAATSVVTEETLATMPKGIGADEAFKLVPGVKVDNQADGERVHLSIRGQGLLTERGIRGIKILLDGLPLNDPTGFAPDLFDVDWQTVRRVEVFRGPSSALFGGGAAGGVINITTRDGGSDQAAGMGTLSLGSNGFWKGMAEFGGTSNRLNYRVSLSRNAGDGYRVHTAFDAANLYGKLHFQATPEFKLTAILAATSFFNENAEGLNLDWLRQDRRLPNPDALTFNEYQRTRRATVGVTGRWTVAPDQNVMFSTYVRHTTWKESVPSSVQHRTYNTPGAIVQYTYRKVWDPYVNHLTVGSD
ncbi:MAG: TonB-dependent receptor plug domain-containing protein, partial [Acidobacteria bacterium]|nr:TonB-dependent receptor plug domain-containing protein [Acidobacteriota bacterium]